MIGTIEKGQVFNDGHPQAEEKYKKIDDRKYLCKNFGEIPRKHH
jgi:hypothetical protein